MSEYAGLSSVQFLLFFRRLIIYTFLALYLRVEIGLSTTETSLMTTVGMVVSSLAQPLLWGRLLDRFKTSSEFVVIGEITAGIGHILMYFWHKSALDSGETRYAGFIIIISLGIIELPWSMSNVGWSTLISEKTTDNERTKLMGQLSVIGGIGGIFGAFTGGKFYQDGNGFSNGLLFYIAGGIMLFSGIILFLAIKSDKINNNVGEQSDENAEIPPLSDLPDNIRKTFIVFLIALALIFFGLNSITLIAIFYIDDSSAFSASNFQISLYRNVWSFFQIIAGISLGFLSTRASDTRILSIGTVFAVIALIWLPLAPTYYLVLITPAFYGLSFVLIRSSSYSIVAKIIPEEYRGRLFGFYNSVFFLSWGLGGTLLAGPIADYAISKGYDTANAYRFSFISALMLVFIGIFVMIYAYKLLETLDKEDSNL